MCSHVFILTYIHVSRFVWWETNMTEMGRKLKVSARSCASTSPPSWVVNLGYGGVVWAAYNRVNLFSPMGFSWAESSSYSGGCYRRASEWEDPPTGPTNDYRKKVPRGIYNWSWVATRKTKYAHYYTPDGLHNRTKQYIRQKWGLLCLVLNDLKKLRLFRIVRSSSLRTRTQ